MRQDAVHTVASVATAVLRRHGVSRVFGESFPGLAHVEVADQRLAALCAAADGQRNHAVGVTWTGDRTLLLTSLPGEVPSFTTTVRDPEMAGPAVEEAAAFVDAPSQGTAAVVFECDLATPVADLPPVPPGKSPWAESDRDTVERCLAAEDPVVLAGPGVVRSGQVPALHDLAVSASLGVLNTWGAKGVFDWRSRHHLATGGLQRDDFRLAGLDDADVVVCVGIDRAETPGGPWMERALHIDPAELGPLSEAWRRSAREIPVVPLRRLLAEVVQGAWAQGDREALHPAKAVQQLSEGMGARGSVAADPGPAGLWLARSFATRRIGDASIPARPGTEGWAVACALVDRLVDPTAWTVAVVDELGEDIALELCEVGKRHGVGIPVQVWKDGKGTTVGEHARVVAELVSGQRDLTHVEVDLERTGDLVDVAGPVVAWHAPDAADPQESGSPSGPASRR